MVQANPHEIGPGEQPDYEIQVSESVDGVCWSQPQVFASSEEGYFDNAVARTKDGWLMVLARGSDLHGTGGLPAQGLWVSWSRELVADRAAWSEPRRVLDTGAAGVPTSLARGVYGPGILHDVARDRTIAYVTGVREAPRWPALLARRILQAQRPVVPAPFYLSVAALELDV